MRKTLLAPAAALLCFAPLRAAAPTSSAQTPAETPEARVERLLARVPLVDGHNDMTEALQELTGGHLERVDLRGDTSRLSEPMQTDIPRLRRGRVGGQFWSVFVSPDHRGAEAVKLLMEQMDLLHRVIDRYPEAFELATTADDVERIHKAGRIASLIGIEGGYSLGNSLAVLRMAHDLGARYVTLTHWRSTDWADAATDAPRHAGLSRFGHEMIREMNRLGVMVDLSHVSDQVMQQALEVSEAPVIFSHSSARALCGHPRNVSDDILRRVATRGSIVMVNFAPGFLDEKARVWDEQFMAKRERLGKLQGVEADRARKELDAWRAAHPAPTVTLAQAADHIEHIHRVAGPDHVGLGSDFDGIGRAPTGLDDVSRYPALLAELARRGWTDPDLEKLAGTNILRIMRRVEEVARRLRVERPPSEATIEELDKR